MFDAAALNAMAQKAKEQLNEQQSAEENLYADFIEDNEGNTENVTEWSRDILTEPSETIEYPSISSIPSEEDYEERPQINPYDTVLFPGGPLQSQVDSWKKQWTGYDIFASEIADNMFIFRTLNRFEYKQIVSLPNTDPLIREEIICETVTLWPEKYDWKRMATDKAGIPSTLAQVIMEKSGFTKEFSIQVL